MTIKKREKIDSVMKKASRGAKFVRKHINKRLGQWLSDRVYDIWDWTYEEV